MGSVNREMWWFKEGEFLKIWVGEKLREIFLVILFWRFRILIKEVFNVGFFYNCKRLVELRKRVLE